MINIYILEKIKKKKETKNKKTIQNKTFKIIDYETIFNNIKQSIIRRKNGRKKKK